MAGLQKKKYFYWKIAGAATFLFLVLVGSEVLYLSKNRPQTLAANLLFPAKYAAEKNNSEIALKFVESAGKLGAYLNSSKYPELIERGDFPTLKTTNTDFEKDLIRTLSDLEITKFMNTTKSDLSKLFYGFSLDAYKSGDKDLTKNLLRYATYLNPQLSHYHVELANLYLLEANYDMAKKVLEDCKKLGYPHEHCQSYENANLNFNQTYDFGFLKPEVEEHFRKRGLNL